MSTVAILTGAVVVLAAVVVALAVACGKTLAAIVRARRRLAHSFQPDHAARR